LGIQKARQERKHDLEVRGFARLVVPPVIRISDDVNRSRLVDFIQSFKKKILAGESKILLDFSQTERIHAGGMILLYAEVTRCVAAFPAIRFRCRVPRKNEKVAQVLVQLGLARMLGEVVPHKPRFADVVHWRVATGDEVRGEKFDDVLGSYDGVIPRELSKSFFRGISEAMTNVRQHAYIQRKNDLIPVPKDYNRWWMFSQKKDEKLSVLFCDLGVGIPKTVPKTRPELLKKLVTLGMAGNDAETIASTIEDSRSRTGLKHRGKGLPQIIDSVKSVDGLAGIYSNRGRYLAGNTPEKRVYNRSVDATIVFWQVDLPP
jgi:hypothetical protein